MSSWRAEKKGELIGYLVAFFISMGFLVFTILKMMEALAIQQDISRRLGIPIHDPYVSMYVLFALVPTLYCLGGVIKASMELKRGTRQSSDSTPE